MERLHFSNKKPVENESQIQQDLVFKNLEIVCGITGLEYIWSMSITKAIENIEASSVDQIASHLNQLVADSYGLLGQLHLAHWNVEGTDFLPLHQMFQDQYEELFVAIDDIAERVRALGKYAEGGLKKLATMSKVNEGPSASATSAKDFVSSVLLAHEVVIEQAVAGRKIAAEAGDAESEDLLIGRVRIHQKAVWFLNSYLK